MGEGGGEGEGGGGGEGGGDGWPASSTSTCYPRQGVSLGAAEQDLAWVKPGLSLGPACSAGAGSKPVWEAYVAYFWSLRSQWITPEGSAYG